MTASSALIGFVALEHAGFLILEMFFWTSPLGLRVFGHSPEAAASSAKLAMNQGLYNGFLSAGLIWGLCAGAEKGLAIKTFFLACVIVAGVFGAATANARIFLVQALPALAALAALRLGR